MPTQFFRVDGADQETGEETYLVLSAKTRPQAEKLARDQGLLIASVRVANPEDWAATYQGAGATASSTSTAHEQTPAEEESQMHRPTHADPASHINEQHEHEAAPEHFVEQAPAVEAVSAYAAEPATPRSRRAASAPPPSSAGPIVLACSGSAMIIGGVLALVLALRPDNVLRNELVQLDYHVQVLAQTVLGSTLVLSGLIVCLIAAMCYLLPRRLD